MNKAMLQLKKYICILLMILLFMPAVAYAGVEKGSLQVVLKNGGIRVNLYSVAAADGTLSADFSGAGISPADMLAEKNARINAGILSAYVQKNEIGGISRTADSGGIVNYTNLGKGIYLVTSEGENGVNMQPFLMMIPMVINGNEEYYLKATPKTVLPGGGGSSGSSGSSKEEEKEEEKEEQEEEKVEEELEKEEQEEEKVEEEQEEEKVEGEDTQVPQNPLGPGNTGIPGFDIYDGDIPQHLLGLYDPDVPQYVLGLYDQIIPQTGAVRYPIWVLNGLGAVCIVAGIFNLRKNTLEDDEEDMSDEEA